MRQTQTGRSDRYSLARLTNIWVGETDGHLGNETDIYRLVGETDGQKGRRDRPIFR